jgi:hypothetical protein
MAPLQPQHNHLRLAGDTSVNRNLRDDRVDLVCSARDDLDVDHAVLLVSGVQHRRERRINPQIERAIAVWRDMRI